ncbi:MAG: dihydrofolate reductase family protein, partial [Lachnospiraceae bacterium]|nr:dihydrofolate reductase family protein [Lachnospiraceae bacterium]
LGSTLHEAAMQAGIINHVCAYIAPKLFGGSEAKTPVEGTGVAFPAESPQLSAGRFTLLGEDILLEYDVIPESKGQNQDVQVPVTYQRNLAQNSEISIPVYPGEDHL